MNSFDVKGKKYLFESVLLAQYDPLYFAYAITGEDVVNTDDFDEFVSIFADYHNINIEDVNMEDFKSTVFANYKNSEDYETIILNPAV